MELGLTNIDNSVQDIRVWWSDTIIYLECLWVMSYLQPWSNQQACKF